MKYRRKITPEIEAHYLDKGTEQLIDFCPQWLKDSINYSIKECVYVETANGEAQTTTPCYFIREENDEGTYPVSVEYFEKHFEEVK